MRNWIVVLLLLFMPGCVMKHIEGIGDVGWKTEQYTLWHWVKAPKNPKTPIEWQAAANEECTDSLMSWRLPDGNLGWKHTRGMTGCLFSFITNECICSGPPATDDWEAANMLNHMRWSTMPERVHLSEREIKKRIEQLKRNLDMASNK